MVKQLLKKIVVMWLRYQYARLYKKYHRTFEENILEAQEQHRLPAATLAVRQHLNKVIDRLRELDPEGGYKNFS